MNSTTRKLGAAVGLASIAAFSVALPASAASTISAWGDWYGMFLTLEFNNPAFPDATFTVSGEESWNNLYPATEDEGFTAADPLGQLIGPNQDSTDTLLLKVETLADNDSTATVDIVFESPVPANQLVVAISDIDSDRAEIEMWDGNDDPLTYLEIAGNEENFAFNWDDPTDTVNVPGMGSNNPTSIILGDAPDNTDGSTGWVRPTVDVKAMEIHINTEDGNFSSQRIWIGQVAAVDSLADTGMSDSLYLAAVAGGALLAAGGFVGLRRRNS